MAHCSYRCRSYGQQRLLLLIVTISLRINKCALGFSACLATSKNCPTVIRSRSKIDDDSVDSSISNSLGAVPNNRRTFLTGHFVRMLTTNSLATALFQPRDSNAATPTKNRTDGYAVQHTEREWAYILSGPQYNILRQGGTERQKSSILNTFTSDKIGTYVCAGCRTPLFESSSKFSSGTGWPSFASALSQVEEEDLDPIRATLDGREVRCGTCGGQLGDLFNDGWLYINTVAAKSGKRYCIDGAALIFQPQGGTEEDFIYGDQPPPNKVIQ